MINLTELLNVFAFSLGLFILIITFNALLQRTVRSAIRGLFFKFSVFLLFSCLAMLLPALSELLGSGYVATLFLTILKCLWWLSLNLHVNEALTYFIWDRLLPSKDITATIG